MADERGTGGAARRHGAGDGRREAGAHRRRRAHRGRPHRGGRARASRCPRAPSRSTRSGGIVMPGMIDTHRHMWQTAMRGYGADWTLTQYFVWYYLESGKFFRPEDVHAGNLLAAIEAIDAGVTTCVDWSHGLQTVDHADAAVDALRVGARSLRAGLRQHPAAAVRSGRPRRSSATSSAAGSPATTCSASRWPSTSPATRPSPRRRPSRWPATSASPVTTHAGRLGRDQRRRHPADARARLHDAGDDLRARGDADRGLLPAHRRHRRLGLGVDRERAERRAGLPAHLGDPQARHPGLAVDGHQRVVERRPVLRDALHAGRRPLARAHGGARQGRHRHPQRAARRAGRRLGDPGRRRGARPRRPRAASRSARRPTSCCSRTTAPRCRSRSSTPTGTSPSRPSATTCTPCWSTAGWSSATAGSSTSTWSRRAARSRPPSSTCARTLGEEAWQQGMNPEVPETALVENPYQYTDYRSDEPRGAH